MILWTCGTEGFFVWSKVFERFPWNRNFMRQHLLWKLGSLKGTVPILMLPSRALCGEKALLTMKKKHIKVFKFSISVSIRHLKVAGIHVCRWGMLVEKIARYLCDAPVVTKTYMQTPLGGFFCIKEPYSFWALKQNPLRSRSNSLSGL